MTSVGRRPRRWPVLLLCLAAAIAVHLLLLAWPLAPRDVEQPAVPARAASRVQVLKLGHALATDALVASEPSTRQPRAVAAPVASEPAASAAATRSTAPASGPQSASTEALGSAVVPDAEPDWWPRERLDGGPQPLQPVLLDSARMGIDQLPAGSNALLFIDASGRVERMEFGGTPLAAAVEEALRAAFAATPFAPGTRDGQPVRARVRIALDAVLDEPPPAQPVAR
ncbi:hypothetical protein [Rivibacter subsaxonicus]|uniref:hypothetical protein n=1 Tax=Rivibacter subsaxonicus TaxID=457575 RepID=UPI00102BD93A|nr:hypothetical protein [Rivibacter subsaxonicus]